MARAARLETEGATCPPEQPAWVGANVGTGQPKTITASLAGGTAYRVAVR